MPTFDNWDEVIAFALSLPGTSMAPHFGTPCPKVNSKAFATPSRESDSFHVPTPHQEKEILIETDPDTFWQTDHYRGWPGVLVRFGSVDPERVEQVIRRAWWDKASRSERKAYGPRP
ncbi:hypothetical protein SAMN05518801_109132 [Novosphingobium sp. CF614]|uniref:MmcQ/YjbR family DNA-binding protein n=1 Tax=Novosphingobium sp. CF614 TaxID=1884364 RepID=UPI0008F25526|nr:MmcQ/YjbR family DNA-binding protein [Novosphingobium sp. CF614]SFG18757.1 hypothetical protein SAMN05518801_109132 [Novosphingobium sp. CF614]